MKFKKPGMNLILAMLMLGGLATFLSLGYSNPWYGGAGATGFPLPIVFAVGTVAATPIPGVTFPSPVPTFHPAFFILDYIINTALFAILLTLAKNLYHR